jgi:ribonuclease BN (tRNA processing enzyme)
VARVARQARVGLLVLVHINPLAEIDDAIGIEQARRIFPKTYVGTDLTEIDF